jgi:hypothetical protein
MHMSLDRYGYVSTPWQPKTVSVIDTVSGETVWSVDVPVGQRLAMQFRENRRGSTGEAVDPSRPDVLQWELMPASREHGELHNQIAVPASHTRRVEMKLRPTPEAPGAIARAMPVSKPPYQNDSAQPDAAQWRRSGESAPTPAAEPMPMAKPTDAVAPAPAATPSPAAAPAPTPTPAPAEPPVDLPE